MSMEFRMLLVAALVAIISVSARAHSAVPNGDSLTGTWVLCQDPDHSPPDSLQFFSEGYGFEQRPGKPKYPFLFKKSDGKLLLLVNAKGNLVNIHMSVNTSHTRLSLKSDRTGNTSFYVRKGQEKKNFCTAKQPHL